MLITISYRDRSNSIELTREKLLSTKVSLEEKKKNEERVIRINTSSGRSSEATQRELKNLERSLKLIEDLINLDMMISNFSFSDYLQKNLSSSEFESIYSGLDYTFDNYKIDDNLDEVFTFNMNCISVIEERRLIDQQETNYN